MVLNRRTMIGTGAAMAATALLARGTTAWAAAQEAAELKPIALPPPIAPAERVTRLRGARDLMRRHGIKARVATIRYTSPSIQRFFDGALNQQLDLELKRPDQVWVGDITYLKVGAIYRYLAVVMDKYSRRVVGWSYGPRKDAALTLRALNRAVASRRPKSGLVFHTDRGTEYAATAFKERLAELGFVQSMIARER